MALLRTPSSSLVLKSLKYTLVLEYLTLGAKTSDEP
jgi:hypothetical protein